MKRANDTKFKRLAIRGSVLENQAVSESSPSHYFKIRAEKTALLMSLMSPQRCDHLLL